MSGRNFLSLRLKRSYKSIFIILVFLLYNPMLGQAPTAPDTDRLVKQYRYRAKKFLVKDYHLNGYFYIGAKGIYMFASPKHKAQRRPEFFLAWQELDYFKDLLEYGDRQYQFEIYKKKGTKPFTLPQINTIQILKNNHQIQPVSKNKPLSGIRIAIDPGHIAGDIKMAKAEGRFIDMTLNKQRIQLKEGDLTLSTAMVLRDSLIKQGADVFISRNKGNHGANDKSYQNWKQTDLKHKLKAKGLNLKQLNYMLRRTPDSKIYRDYFLHDDLEKRAEKINYYKPHLTVILHYNADDKNYGWKKPSQRNFGMVFVPGSFLKYELRGARDRFDFIRTLISEQVKESAILSKLIMSEFEQQLKVPSVKVEEEPNYLKKLAIRLDDGVYARNLRLCRLLNTPICYGEPLLQDNEKELLALKDNDLSKGKITNRVVEVANSYYVGIMKYFEKKGRNYNMP